jgi:hypothetical protein
VEIDSFDSKPANQQTSPVKTTLDLPADLVKAMKLRAVHEGRKLKDVAAELLERGLQGKPPLQVVPEKGAIQFPLIQCGPDAPASRMTTEELLALEQEVFHQEDLQRLGISL